MGIDIRMPNINAPTDAGQLQQIRSYLYQFAEQMKWALDTMGAGSNETIVKQGEGSASESSEEADAMATFNEVKSLIIKSADIVDAYYEEIDKMISLSGKYVAQSEFGDYTEETNQTISATSEYVTQTLTKVETIEGKLDGIESSIKEKESYIRYGYVGTTLDDTGIATNDAPGIEIGDFNEFDGTVYKRFARFTAYGLELFGNTLDHPVAYIKQSKLYIVEAEITGTLKLGGYRIDTSNGLSFKWIGR